MDEEDSNGENSADEEESYNLNNVGGGLNDESDASSQEGATQSPAVWVVYAKTLTGKTIELEANYSTTAFCEECLGPCGSTIQHYDLVKSLQDKYKWGIYFTIDLVREFRRFLELKCCMKDWECTKVFASPLIDKVWEECLQDTREYERICKQIHRHCGATGPHRFIHRIAKNTGNLQSTCIAYEARFSDPPDDAFWSWDADAVLEAPPTCSCLAASVFRKEGIPVKMMRFTYMNKQLLYKPIRKYRVQHLSTVHLVLRLSGC